MAVDERRRRALHGQVAGAWGQEAADTLFELLVPPGHDPATRQDLRAGFAEVGMRFADVDQHLVRIDQRLAEMDQRFDGIDQRLAEMDQRFEGIDQQFMGIDQQFMALRADLDQRFTTVDAQFAAMREQFERRITDAVSIQTRTLVFSQLAALVAIAALAFGLQ